MTPLAAAEPIHTWGIPGPTFLAAYLGLAALIVLGSMLHRATLFNGTHTPGFDQLGPQQVAFLNGGPRLAVYSAISGLRAAGALDATDRRGQLRVSGALPVGATPLDQAIHFAVGQGVRTRDLPREHLVASALGQLRQDLENRRLALGPAQRRAARIGPVLLGVLIVVGVVRLFAGINHHQPVGFLILSMVLLVPIMLTQAIRVPYRTRAGRRALRNLRSHYGYLTPANSPAYHTYGAAGVAMGVGLFGGAALWALDPGFAEAADVERHIPPASATGGCAVSTGGGDSGSSGGGDSSCSSCGGCGGCGG